jgi:YfiH family protein
VTLIPLLRIGINILSIVSGVWLHSIFQEYFVFIISVIPGYFPRDFVKVNDKDTILMPRAQIDEGVKIPMVDCISFLRDKYLIILVMILDQEQGLPLWRFKNLSAHTMVSHFVSGREGGISEGEKASLNLGRNVGDTPEAVQTNIGLLAKALSIAPEQILFPRQTHSNNVAFIRNGGFPSMENTDGIVSNRKGICLTVLSADCVPVLLYDPVAGVVGAIHAGWRGTTAKILSNAVALMLQQFGSSPRNIIASIGPSIGPDSYEVGEEVIRSAQAAFTDSGELLVNISENKARFNLWKANEVQLLELGILPENIEIAGICTYKNNELFFSARHSKNKAGRFSAGIMLKE